MAEGKSKALPGQSLHNYTPAYAFDVAFLAAHGGADWGFHLFQAWGELAEELGLEWGGRWPDLVDGPHVQAPMSWRDARAGRVPELPPIPRVSDHDVLVLHPHPTKDPIIIRQPFRINVRGGKVDIRWNP